MTERLDLSAIVPAGIRTACFTGHRPKNIHGYEKTPYYPIVDVTQSVCRAMTELGVSRFISGGAQGFDQLAFWAVDRLNREGAGVENVIYVPFPKQPNRWKATGLFSRDEYALMLQKASSVDVLADDPATDDVRAAARLLHARNHAMVDNSDVVIAFLTGEVLETGVANSKGGTAECVRYALKAGKAVVAIEYRPGTARPFTVTRVAT